MHGHEREDVVKYRKEYLKTVNSLHSSHLPPPPCSDVSACSPPEDAETRKKLMVMFHDERIFNISEGQGWIWGTRDLPFVQPKNKWAGIMVSDFIAQQDGYLALSSEECELATHVPRVPRVFLEYGGDKEGYLDWRSVLLMCGMWLQLPASSIPMSSIPFVAL